MVDIASVIRQRRLEMGISQETLAEMAGTSQTTIDKIENGRSARSRFLPAVCSALGIDLKTIDPAFASVGMPLPNATMAGSANLDVGVKVPAYGKAMGGRHGEFVLNGNKIDDILAPPSLRGVKEAYAVYVAGESMEPRYEAGEVLFVNPRLPVRRSNYVVAQIANPDDETSPLAFIKRFVSKGGGKLKLEQFNPPEVMEFDEDEVVSVHKVVMGGEG